MDIIVAANERRWTHVLRFAFLPLTWMCLVCLEIEGTVRVSVKIIGR